MTAGKTSDALLYVGGSAWLANLSEVANSVDVSGTLNTDDITVIGSTGVEVIATSVAHMINVPVMYHGVEAEALRSRQGDTTEAIVALFVPNQGCYFGPAIWPDVSFSSEVSSVVQRNVSFQQSENWYRRSGTISATEFTIKASASSTTIGDIEPNSRICIIVDKFDPTTSVTFNIGTLTPALKGVGILSITSGTAKITGGNIDATVSGSDEIHGYVLIATEFEVA